MRRIDTSKLAGLRVRRGLSQQQLADRLGRRGFGTTQETVSRWEHGQQPRGWVREALAEELGVPLDELYGDDDDASVHLSQDLVVVLRDALGGLLDGRRLVVAR
jgi:transcriptional regulator with XRE-family HTH domain